MDRPWWREANKVDFEAEGFKCALRRGPCGAWCGYVGVSKEHPWHGKSYSEKVKPSPEEALSISLCMRVHGGLTYSADHEPFGEPDGRWWFGFDCAHAGDLVPDLAREWRAEGAVYRTQEYVAAEVQSLAAQLANVAREST